MGDLELLIGEDELLQTFEGTPNQSVRLCSVQVRVTKNFLETTSDPITINAPEGRTIEEIVGTEASVYPGDVDIVEIDGILYVEFNASIWIAVCLDDDSCVMLSDTITVQGEIGPSDEIKVVNGEIPEPHLECIDCAVDPGGASVTGKIRVPSFEVVTAQLKSVKVVLDPDVVDPVGDPIDP